MFLRRRRLIAASGLAVASSALPRVAIGQADHRPTITIAVQQVATSASLEPVREQSNVGERTFTVDLRDADRSQNLKSKLEPVPGLAESWKRIDERTVELSLRKGVKFHNGDEMTAEDVVFTFSPERMFGTTTTTGSTRPSSRRCWRATASKARSCRPRFSASPSAASRRSRRSR